MEYDPSTRRTVLHPNHEDLEKYTVKVNGDLVDKDTEVKHGDRILVGNHHYFLFVDPL